MSIHVEKEGGVQCGKGDIQEGKEGTQGFKNP